MSILTVDTLDVMRVLTPAVGAFTAILVGVAVKSSGRVRAVVASLSIIGAMAGVGVGIATSVFIVTSDVSNFEKVVAVSVAAITALSPFPLIASNGMKFPIKTVVISSLYVVSVAVLYILWQGKPASEADLPFGATLVMGSYAIFLIIYGIAGFPKGETDQAANSDPRGGK